MPEDYAAAAARHFRDGSLLRDQRRISNADQLFGFAAECAIKSALIEIPGFLAAGTLAPAYRKHINDLWDLVQLQGIQKRHPQLLAVLKGLPRPFSGWSTALRYDRDDAVATPTLEGHRRAAVRVLGSLGLSGTREG